VSIVIRLYAVTTKHQRHENWEFDNYLFNLFDECASLGEEEKGRNIFLTSFKIEEASYLAVFVLLFKEIKFARVYFLLI